MSAPSIPRHYPRSVPAYVTWSYVRGALLPALLVVLVPALVGFVVSDYFRLREVVVRSRLPGLADEVASQLDVPENANTVLLPLPRLVSQVVRCPRVHTATARRDLPSRVIIDIEAREPAFSLQAERGFVMVDREGVLVFHTGRPAVGMPAVLGIIAGQRGIGGRLNADCLAAVLACMAGAAQGGMAPNFALDLSTRYDYRLTTPSRVEVKLGGPDNLARKVITAAALERHLRARRLQAEYIDVRVASRPPVWKPRQKPS